MKKIRRFILHIKTPQGVVRHDTGKIKRFLHYTRLIKWQTPYIRVYLKVTNGKQEDVFGKRVEFYNDGWYDNKEDFDLTYQSFIEE